MAPLLAPKYVDIGKLQPNDGDLCYIIRHPWYSAPIEAKYQEDPMNGTALFKFASTNGNPMIIPWYAVYKWRNVI